MTTVNNAQPSEDFLNSLYHEAVDVSTNQVEVYEYIARTVFKAGLNRKIEDVKWLEKKRDRSINSLIIQHTQSSEELVKRIEFAGRVILNTLRKMTHGTPEEFGWVYGGRRIAVRGIYRKPTVLPGRSSRPNEDITAQISRGTIVPGPDHVVVFSSGGFDAELPLSLLNNDPIAIAQMVRAKCRAYAETTIRTQLNELIRKKKDMAETHESEMKKLEKALEEKRAFSKMKPAGRRKKKVPAGSSNVCGSVVKAKK